MYLQTAGAVKVLQTKLIRGVSDEVVTKVFLVLSPVYCSNSTTDTTVLIVETAVVLVVVLLTVGVEVHLQQ